MKLLTVLLIAVALTGCGGSDELPIHKFAREQQEKSMREHIKSEQKQFDAQMKAQGHDEYWMDDNGQIRRGKGEGYYQKPGADASTPADVLLDELRRATNPPKK